MTERVRPSLLDLYSWPPVVPLWPDAASVYGLSRTTAYDLAGRGEFPCRILRLGRLMKVSTADLLTSLGMPITPPPHTPQPSGGETRESLLARRDAILEALDLSSEEFRTLYETRTLTGDEWAAREELDQIAFLLGE